MYTIGRIVPRFPDLGLEKEFAQAAGGVAPDETIGTDQLRAVLVRRENAYLTTLICWTFTSADMDAFTIRIRDAAEAASLVEALPAARDTDTTVQAIIGHAGPAHLDEPCAAAGLPSVSVDHLLTFPLTEFIDALVADVEEKEQATARDSAKDLYTRLTRHSTNWGFSPADRARNYLALRYLQMYHLVYRARCESKVFLGLDSREMSSPGTRQLVAVRLGFRDRRTDVVEQYQCVVDVTDRFPFLASALTSVYD
ncbi:hypothetical protein ACSYGO_46270 [Streptomyces krungchingensis]